MNETNVTPSPQPSSPAETQTPATPPNTLITDPAKQTSTEQPQTEQKPPEQKPEEKKAEAQPLQAADLVLPENFTVTDEQRTAVLDLANKNNLSKEALGEFVKLHADLMQKASESASQEFETLQNQWKQEVQNDPEIGGQNLNNTIATIGKALSQYGDEATRQAFDLTGAGNNPAIVKFIHKMAKAVSESGPVSGTPGVGGETSTAKILYPNQK